MLRKKKKKTFANNFQMHPFERRFESPNMVKKRISRAEDMYVHPKQEEVTKQGMKNITRLEMWAKYM